MQPKKYNEEYFRSIKDQAKRRYAQWLIQFAGYGYSIFDGMNNALLRADDNAMQEYEAAYPAESEWFNKHLAKDPEAVEIQNNLFNWL